MTRILALFLSLGLTLPAPALALRTSQLADNAGLEELRKALSAGLEEYRWSDQVSRILGTGLEERQIHIRYVPSQQNVFEPQKTYPLDEVGMSEWIAPLTAPEAAILKAIVRRDVGFLFPRSQLHLPQDSSLDFELSNLEVQAFLTLTQQDIPQALHRLSPEAVRLEVARRLSDEIERRLIDHWYGITQDLDAFPLEDTVFGQIIPQWRAAALRLYEKIRPPSSSLSALPTVRRAIEVVYLPVFPEKKEEGITLSPDGDLLSSLRQIRGGFRAIPLTSIEQGIWFEFNGIQGRFEWTENYLVYGLRSVGYRLAGWGRAHRGWRIIDADENLIFDNPFGVGGIGLAVRDGRLTIDRPFSATDSSTDLTVTVVQHWPTPLFAGIPVLEFSNFSPDQILWVEHPAGGLEETVVLPYRHGADAAQMYEVAFSPDGAWLYSAEHSLSHERIRRWNVARQKEGKPVHLHAAIRHLMRAKHNLLAFDSELTLAALGTLEKGVPITKIVGLSDGRPKAVLRHSPAEGASVKRVFFGPSRTVFTQVRDTVELWSLDSSRKVAELDYFTEGQAIESVAIKPDGSTIALGDSEGRVRLADVATETVGPPIAYEHPAGVTALAFSPDGRFLATGTSGMKALDKVADRIVRIIDLQTGKEVPGAALWLPGSEEPIRLAYSPDGKKLAVGGYEGSVRIWTLPPMPNAGMEETLEALLTRAKAAFPDNLEVEQAVAPVTTLLGDMPADLKSHVQRWPEVASSTDRLRRLLEDDFPVSYFVFKELGIILKHLKTARTEISKALVLPGTPIHLLWFSPPADPGQDGAFLENVLSRLKELDKDSYDLVLKETRTVQLGGVSPGSLGEAAPFGATRLEWPYDPSLGAEARILALIGTLVQEAAHHQFNRLWDELELVAQPYFEFPSSKKSPLTESPFAMDYLLEVDGFQSHVAVWIRSTEKVSGDLRSVLLEWMKAYLRRIETTLRYLEELAEQDVSAGKVLTERGEEMIRQQRKRQKELEMGLHMVQASRLERRLEAGPDLNIGFFLDKRGVAVAPLMAVWEAQGFYRYPAFAGVVETRAEKESLLDMARALPEVRQLLDDRLIVVADQDGENREERYAQAKKEALAKLDQTKLFILDVVEVPPDWLEQLNHLLDVVGYQLPSDPAVREAARILLYAA